jgi:hypothetical protein
MIDVQTELGLWADAGIAARFWCRDDDAAADVPQLRRLLDVARDSDISIALAVIPERADDSLGRLVSTENCCIWQHGWGHHFHHAGEFGEARPLDLMVRDALAGQRALDRLLGPSGWQRVFVPPNHALSMPFKSLIPSLGYLGVSAGVQLTPPLDHVVEVNAEIDVMNWPEGKILSESAICRMIADQLRSRRTGSIPIDRPIGLLTHHLAFDDDAWTFMFRLFALLRSHNGVEVVRADTLFGPDRPRSLTAVLPGSISAQTRNGAVADITVVLTSCGRRDLLARTLDSFLQYNTCPIHELVVMEDGVEPTPLSREERYRKCNIRWLSTGKRIGQMPAIDLAYGLVETEYIFHCEDDWEFFAPGFIEKSLSILQRNADILQVWIRALSDTNRHPVMEHIFYAADIPYRLMMPGFHTEEWGTWHGFSFNPGLRRRRDMLLIGSFAAMNPLRQKPSYEVERQASEFYMNHGFLAAILADEDGKGYVRHIGWGRRVGEPADGS